MGYVYDQYIAPEHWYVPVRELDLHLVRENVDLFEKLLSWYKILD